MTPTAIAVLELASLTFFAFGTVAFVLLAAAYWRSQPRHGGVFRLFAVACAASFLSSLGIAVAVSASGFLAVVQAFATGLIPPLLVHVQMERAAQPRRWMLLAFYSAALINAAARTVNPTDALDAISTAILGAAAPVCLIHNPRPRLQTLLFAGLALCAAGELATAHPLFAATPDYLILLFFAVHLYDTERLLFFDIFLKGGAYFATGFLLLTAAVILNNRLLPVVSGLERIWFGVLFLMPVWLLAPALQRRLQTFIDRRILHRRYRMPDAEKLFTAQLQNATTPQQLNQQAATTLTQIFGCPAIAGDLPEPPTTTPADITVPVVPNGFLRLQAGARPIHFLSEDYMLLQSLAGILGQYRHTLHVRELREQTTRAELRALRAQINPHFLFNALNAVAACVRSRPDVADDTLMQLADVFRYTLRRSDSEWVRLADELHFIRSYLAVEQTRFHGRLHTQVEADAALLALSVPAMLIQPLVENAIKHGTARLTASGKVQVTVARTADSLRITVTDNGPGFPSAAEPLPGYGLRNVADRLRGYYGAAATLQWHNGAEWTTVSLEFPLEVRQQCAS